jgi:hypothetical protein
MSSGLYAYKKHFYNTGNNRRISEVCNLKCWPLRMGTYLRDGLYKFVAPSLYTGCIQMETFRNYPYFLSSIVKEKNLLS